MNNEEVKLVRKKKKKKGLKKLLARRGMRYLLTFLCILPFIVVIVILSINTLNEINNIRSMVSGDTTTVISDENNIANGMYILRDTATDLQKEYFAELKNAIEVGGEGIDGTAIAGMVAKNYVADFYTWTNKQGQFDIGGMYYIYDGEFVNGDHYKENVYLKARDGFYKYLSTYVMTYGRENLLEVDNVNITRCEKLNQQYVINEHIENRQDENGEWYDYREDRTYDAYYVSASWTYKPETQLNLSQYATSLNMIVIDHYGQYVIVEASENAIDVNRKKENETAETEETEGAETEGTEADATVSEEPVNETQESQ